MSLRIALPALGLAAAAALAVGPLAAAAHSDDLFTVVRAGEEEAFATVTKADADVTPLPTTVTDRVFRAVELLDERGYAVGQRAALGSWVFTWDHATGAVLDEVEVTAAGWAVNDLFALDTVRNGALPDGTLLTIARLAQQDAFWTGVGSVDPVTGVFTPIVDLTELDLEYFIVSIATDPTSGSTSVFLDREDGPLYLELDLAGGTYTGPSALVGIGQSAAYIQGADFDESGILWFYDDESRLSSTAGPFSAEVTAIVSGTSEGVNAEALAVDALSPAPPPPPLPATGAGETAAGIAAAAVLMTVGGALLLARRATT